MTNTPQPLLSPDVVQLLQRIVRMRGRFKVVAPENLVALRKQIHDAKQPGKDAGIGDPGLFYNVGSAFFRYDGPISMGELSRDLEVPLSTATRTMDWLVNNGYAQRLPDLKDRRVVLVELTRKGKETFETIRTFMLARVEQAISKLDEEEQKTLICLLNKVLDGFEAVD
ncbi:MAG TPA: MarR family transcriptional regulator [Anaerolineales bacterium]|nr:MarR family transcriptional regulator [Anaerolineales bacterium]